MTTNRFAALLADRSPVFDGGYGWLLQERGLPAPTGAIGFVSSQNGTPIGE